MRFSLMPKKSIFFTLFSQHAQNAREATQALEQLLSDFTDVDNKARDIHAIEHYGDKLTHQIMQELNGTFVTPLDREDIVGLASKLDDVTDVCHDVAEMIVLYKVRTIRPLAIQQAKVLVAAAEQVAGKKLDIDRLRTIVDRVNQQEEYFDEVRTIIATADKLPARLGEVMGQTMGIQWHRGTDWALNQARAFRDEVKQRAETQQWVCPNEQYRLMYVGAGLWQNLDFFTEFEEKYGAVFVRSNYLSIASDGYLRYGTRDPLRCLASRYVTISEQMHIPGLGGAWAGWAIGPGSRLLAALLIVPAAFSGSVAAGMALATFHTWRDRRRLRRWEGPALRSRPAPRPSTPSSSYPGTTGASAGRAAGAGWASSTWRVMLSWSAW